MNAYENFLDLHKRNKNIVKVFLDSGTMLQGVITDYDETTIIIDKCFVNLDKIISIAPLK
jgi:sRNA-binding regulator protein Hfq